MIYIILIGYVLPILVNSVNLYKDEEVETVGDFLKYFWTAIIPFINFFIMCLIPLIYISDLLKDRFDIQYMWENLMNKKIKKEKGL